jgi:hypothetical protein
MLKGDSYKYVHNYKVKVKEFLTLEVGMEDGYLRTSLLRGRLTCFLK